MSEVIELLQHISIFEPLRETYDEIWRIFESQTHVHSLVAVENNKVVGYGSIVIENKIRGGTIGHIEDIVVTPSRRKHGIGKAILEALYDIAKTNDAYKVSLACQEHNVGFYLKCHYSSSGRARRRENACQYGMDYVRKVKNRLIRWLEFIDLNQKPSDEIETIFCIP
jgi:glucosamine-phosphate N-acetyltransferase